MSVHLNIVLCIVQAGCLHCFSYSRPVYMTPFHDLLSTAGSHLTPLADLFVHSSLVGVVLKEDSAPAAGAATVAEGGEEENVVRARREDVRSVFLPFDVNAFTSLLPEVLDKETYCGGERVAFACHQEETEGWS